MQENRMKYLRNKLDKHKPRVDIRYKHFDMKYQERNVSITMPPEIQNRYRAVLGWTSKAVESMADRLVFREFGNDNFELNQIFKMNNADILFDSAILSALVASCAFVYISKDENDYPRLQVIEASNATGTIDPITGLLKEGYAVLSRDEHGQPYQEAFFETGMTTIVEGGEVVSTHSNNAPAPLLVPIVHRPDAVRPFGRSRITRAGIYWQANAKRTLERADVTAEFYSFPQKYVVGTSPDSEPMDAWRATVSSMLEFTKDEDGDKPSLGQFTAPSMTPFIDQLRMAAAGFAGETGLTLDDLGFVSDNPSSSEAIKASHETLRVAARKAQRNFGSGFLNVGFLAACVRDDITYTRDQFYETEAKWEPVFEPDASTLSTVGDGAIKINQAIPGYFNKENLHDLTGIKGAEDGRYNTGIIGYATEGIPDEIPTESET